MAIKVLHSKEGTQNKLFYHELMGAEVKNGAKYPMVVSTWPFVDAVRAAWKAVNGGLSAIDAVVEGCSACEELRCDGTETKSAVKLCWHLYHWEQFAFASYALRKPQLKDGKGNLELTWLLHLAFHLSFFFFIWYKFTQAVSSNQLTDII